MSELNLSEHQTIFIKQSFELGEVFGFETRNKYQIKDAHGVLIGYAAEQQQGVLGFFLRQFLGHWRSFSILFFTADRHLTLIAHHPFRWFFKRVEVKDAAGQHLGAIQQRFSILTKRFDVENANQETILKVSSPIWRPWTYAFVAEGETKAFVRKKWSGLLAEGFTDKDNFAVEFAAQDLDETERSLVMASALFIDLLYFEQKK